MRFSKKGEGFLLVAPFLLHLFPPLFLSLLFEVSEGGTARKPTTGPSHPHPKCIPKPKALRRVGRRPPDQNLFLGWGFRGGWFSVFGGRNNAESLRAQNSADSIQKRNNADSLQKQNIVQQEQVQWGGREEAKKKNSASKRASSQVLPGPSLSSSRPIA